MSLCSSYRLSEKTMGIENSRSPAPEEIAEHYASGYEQHRLDTQTGRLENERTRDFFRRFLPPAPATILDVGGGPGTHACWLARQGYKVHLIDVTPLHVELAKEASLRQPDAPLASVGTGDARSLPWSDESIDAVLLLGPLYHLTEREDRLKALRQAHRVLRPGGILIGVGISRFASTLDGLRTGFMKDPHFGDIVTQDLKNGQHRNPTGRPEYFMQTFFHHPDELRSETAECGFSVTDIYGLEGPGWLVGNFEEWWENPQYRERLLEIARSLESEPSLIGLNAHLVVVGTKAF
jgi:ubiquinone/menaquinone biosynthesis C-methylase UbiE